MGSAAHCLGYVCIILKITALVSSLVGLGIPYWYKGDATESTGVTGTVKTTIREGLWKKCTVLESTSSTQTFCVGNDGMFYIFYSLKINFKTFPALYSAKLSLYGSY